jgi:hypothetical protein
MRGGARVVANAGDLTVSLAHYWTYLDVPAVEVLVRPDFPFHPLAGRAHFDDGYLSHTVLSAERSRVTGGSLTTALPAWYSVLRLEAAYIHDEARFRQSTLDPFIFLFDDDGRRLRPDQLPDPVRSGRHLGASSNVAIGLDRNWFVPWLNPTQSFLLSTQVFYKRLRHPHPSRPLRGRTVNDGEVLPVPASLVRAGGLDLGTPIEPLFITQPTEQILQTLVLTTSYRGGTITPVLGALYDWGGAIVLQPQLIYSRDPYRVAIDVSWLEASSLKGGSGISLLRDRDNVHLRLEVVW